MRSLPASSLPPPYSSPAPHLTHPCSTPPPAPLALAPPSPQYTSWHSFVCFSTTFVFSTHSPRFPPWPTSLPRPSPCLKPSFTAIPSLAFILFPSLVLACILFPAVLVACTPPSPRSPTYPVSYPLTFSLHAPFMLPTLPALTSPPLGSRLAELMLPSCAGQENVNSFDGASTRYTAPLALHVLLSHT